MKVGDLLSTARASKLHWSWLPALAALVWVLARDHLPRVGAHAAAAAPIAALAMASVAIQEAARRVAIASAGGPVAPVTLWPAGGVSQAATPPSMPAEIRAAYVGPLASFALAATFGVVNAGGTFGAAADVLARFNLAFAAFSLIPASPLAGSGVLRSALRARGRSFAEASATAARAGLVFGALLIGTGVARVVTGDERGGIGLAVAGAIAGAAARADAKGVALGRRNTPRSAIASLPIMLVMLLAVATLYHPPLALAAPGEPFDVLGDVEVTEHTDRSPVNGRYLAASVQIQDPSALHAFVSLFRRDHYLIPREDLRPLVEDPFRPAAEPGALFRLGRDYATVAAALAVGIPVELHGNGVRVVAAGLRARAAGFLPGDTIVGVDGQPIDRLEELRDVVVARPAGASFELLVERDGQRIVRSIRSVVSERSGDVPYLDMQGLTEDFRYEVPFRIRFRADGELGSSGGLAYALAIADLLDPRDLARGRTIVATGRVDVTGRVRPIIGAIAKQWSALEAGATLFVVSGDDAAALRNPVVRVIGVNSVEEAVERLLAE